MEGEVRPAIQLQETSGSPAPDVRIICRVCQKQWSKYACPRCNVRYCSLPCYKAHSNRCTEGFYRENAEHELRQRKADPEERRKMLQTLKRMQEADADDMLGSNGEEEPEGGGEDEEMEEEGGFEISEETLRRLSKKGSHLSLDDLTHDERIALRKAAASGALSRFIPPWEPWYLSPEAKHIRISKTGTRAVREVSPGGREAGRSRADEAFKRLMRQTGGTEKSAEQLLAEIPSVAPESNQTRGIETLVTMGGGSGPGEISEGDHPDTRDTSSGTAAPFSEAPLKGLSSHDPSNWRADVSTENGPSGDVSDRRSDVSDEEGPIIPPPSEEDLPPLSSLTKSPPSPLLGFHLTSVLYAYCYVMRVFNGEWEADPPDAADTLMSVSPVLSEGAAPSSAEDALHGCLERACSPLLAGPSGSGFGRALMGDVTGLLSLGRPGVVCALADAQRILLEAQKGDRLSAGGVNEAAKKGGAVAGSERLTRDPMTVSKVQVERGLDYGTGTSAFERGESSQSSRKGVQKSGRKLEKGKSRSELVRRKVFFFLVWANEQPDPVFQALAAAANECWEEEKRHLENEDRQAERDVQSHTPFRRFDFHL